MDEILTHSKKVFILGDSRTGTTSLHQFFVDLGYSCKHYFVDEAKAKTPLTKFYDENSKLVIDYIKNSGYQCFSDYPTRLFYKDIYREWPDALYILTSRNYDSDWVRSMKRFFEADYNFSDKQLEHLLKNYHKLNNEIRIFFSSESTSSFLDLVIDTDSSSEKLSSFLSLTETKKIPVKNKS